MSEKVFHIDWIRANATMKTVRIDRSTTIYNLEFVDDKYHRRYVGRGYFHATAESNLINEMRNAGYTIRYSTDLPDESTKPSDPVNSPAHYKQGDIECIEAIKAALTPEEYQGYLKGNAFKYIWRSNHKGKPKEDVKKAVWYLNRLEVSE